MSVIYLFMYITLTAIKFYLIIKSLFSIRFFLNSSTQPRALAIDYSDIVVARFDMLNVIYSLHTLILLVCLPQIYVHSSPNTSLITRNALEK